MFCLGVFVLLIPFEVSFADPNANVNNATTTVKPITTTTVKPITTTTAPPVPSTPKFYVQNSTGICLMLQMDLKVNIRYYDKKDGEQYVDFYLNKTDQPATANGTCAPAYQSINVYWTPSKGSNKTFGTTLKFTLDANSGHFSLASISFNYSLSDHDFPSTNDTTSSYSVAHDVSQFTCPIGYYYRCLAEQTFKLTSIKPNLLPEPLVLYQVSSMKVEAFRNSPKQDFIGKERMCTADYVPNRVIPIVVGVILAVLILIAIIAFIIGSRRRRAGYQTI